MSPLLSNYTRVFVYVSCKCSQPEWRVKGVQHDMPQNISFKSSSYADQYGTTAF